MGRWWKFLKKRLSAETTTGGREWLWTGERQQREGTPPSQVTASHLLPDSDASCKQCWIAPERQKTYKTARCNPKGWLLFWWQMSAVKSHCFQRNPYKRQMPSCLTHTFVSSGTIGTSNQVKWCIKYEWVSVKCFPKPVITQLHKEGRIMGLAFNPKKKKFYLYSTISCWATLSRFTCVREEEESQES